MLSRHWPSVSWSGGQPDSTLRPESRPRSPSGLARPPGGRWNTRLVAVAVALLLSGCSLSLGRSQYRVEMPMLDYMPIVAPCSLETEYPLCVTLMLEDFNLLMVELKSACLALGGSDKDCVL